MAEEKSNKNSSQILKILVSATLLFLVFISVDLGKIRDYLAELDAGRIVLLLCVYWVAQLVSTQRWRIFASSLGMTGSYFRFVQIYFVGMFFNVGLPALVGGDVIKAYVISRKDDASLKHGIASVLQDRVSGLITLMLMGLAAILLNPLSWRGFSLWLIYALGWAAVLIALLLIWKGERIYHAWTLVESPSLVNRVLKQISRFHQILGKMELDAKAAAGVIILSIINSALVIWIVFQLCSIVGQPVNLIAIAAVVPLIEILTMLPISIAGLGIREWAFVEALAIFGVTSDAALSVALALSGLIIVRNLAGIVFLPSIPKSLRSKEAVYNAVRARQAG